MAELKTRETTASVSSFLKQIPDPGKYKTGVGCLYLKRLDDVDQTVLKQLVTRAVKSPGAPTA